MKNLKIGLWQKSFCVLIFVEPTYTLHGQHGYRTKKIKENKKCKRKKLLVFGRFLRKTCTDEKERESPITAGHSGQTERQNDRTNSSLINGPLDGTSELSYYCFRALYPVNVKKIFNFHYAYRMIGVNYEKEHGFVYLFLYSIRQIFDRDSSLSFDHGRIYGGPRGEGTPPNIWK